jgi:pyruvate/2-oxoglutarate dehydrogenase complex dihydrolipoamide acyltransferase (E2) component
MHGWTSPLWHPVKRKKNTGNPDESGPVAQRETASTPHPTLSPRRRERGKKEGVCGSGFHGLAPEAITRRPDGLREEQSAVPSQQVDKSPSPAFAKASTVAKAMADKPAGKPYPLSR